MKNVRQGRTVLSGALDALPHPRPWEWVGGMALRRARKDRFRTLAAHLDPDSFRSFCAAIGFVEVNWAFFESQMDRWVEVAYNVIKFRFGGPDAPISYSRKSAYLTEAFQRNTRLSSFRARGVEILSKAETISVVRHDLTHGVITGLEPVDFFKFMLENRKLKRTGRHSFKEITFDIRDFPQLAKDLTELGSRSVRLTSDLADRFL